MDGKLVITISLVLIIHPSLTHAICKLHNETSAEINNRPIVGILAQEYKGSLKSTPHSYIAASYVKAMESAGGRVVPIFPDKDEDYYKELLRQINGVLFPGGSANLIKSKYAKAGKFIYDYAVKSNIKGHYFPIWGTCLGFELLSVLGNNNSYNLVNCSSSDRTDSLQFVIKNGTKLFGPLTERQRVILSTENVTVNYHKKCVSVEDFKASKALNSDFKYITTTTDENGLEYVSSMEGKQMPIYGVQFHPEKIMFEFVLKDGRRNTPHTWNAVLVNQYFSNFFVNETRKNFNCFDNALKERKALIYNYDPEYTGMTGNSVFEQCYFFPMSSALKSSSNLFVSVFSIFFYLKFEFYNGLFSI